MFEAERDLTWYRNVAGALLIVGGIVALMGIMTGEALYPGYHTGDNQISDLGGTEPPNSIVMQPSAAIFDTTMMITGALFIVAALMLHRSGLRRSVTIPVLLLGIGSLGVGIFPGNTGTIHAVFAMLTFISGGLAAMLSYRALTSPFRYVALVLGAIGLSTLIVYMFFGAVGPFADLGIGGVERWVAYPIILWSIGFGGFMSGSAPDKSPLA